MKINLYFKWEKGASLTEAVCPDVINENPVMSIGRQLLRGAGSIIEKIDKNSPVKVLEKFKGTFMTVINNKLNENKIPLKVEYVEFEMVGENTIKAAVRAENPDYDKLAERFLPQVLDNAPCNVKDFLDIIGDDAYVIVKSVLNSITDEKKDALCVLAAEKYNKEICKVVTDFFYKNLIMLTADKIEIEKPVRD